MDGFRVTFSIPVFFALCLAAQAQQIHRNGFEQKTTFWMKGPTDAVFEEVAHNLSPQSHDGQQSEFIHVNVKQGTYLHYQYNTQRASINEELLASVWVKANRPGFNSLPVWSFPMSGTQKI